MKIVINTCYGGFGLSPEAEQEYARLKNLKLYYYKQTSSKYDLNKPKSKRKDVFKRVDNATTGTTEDAFVLYTFTKDYGPQVEKLPMDENTYFASYDIPRDDPCLIQVVETMGVSKASGRYAELKIVEIPDKIEWRIEEYDGIEHVAQAHQTWS